MNFIRFTDLCAQGRINGQRVFIRADLNVPLGEAGQRCKKIVVLSVARLLGQAIRYIHEETSVSSLFV